MSDWISRQDAVLVQQAQDFSTYVSANAAALGLLPIDATGLAADVLALKSANDLAESPSTRTEITIGLRDTSRGVVISRMRGLGRRIQANPSTTNAQRQALGLRVRQQPGVIPAPSTKPVLTATQVVDRTVSVRMADSATPTKRSKAAGALGAEIFAYEGDVPPSDLSGWVSQGVATRAKFDVVVTAASAAAGKKVWITARWFSRRGEVGPLATPICAFVGGGIVAGAA